MRAVDGRLPVGMLGMTGFRRTVATLGLAVPPIRIVDHTAQPLVTRIGDGVTAISSAVAFVCDPVTLIGRAVTRVCDGVSLVSHARPLVSSGKTLLHDNKGYGFTCGSSPLVGRVRERIGANPRASKKPTSGTATSASAAAEATARWARARGGPTTGGCSERATVPVGCCCRRCRYHWHCRRKPQPTGLRQPSSDASASPACHAAAG